MRSKGEILMEGGSRGWWMRCKRTIERGTNGGRKGTSCRGWGGQKRAVGQELSRGRNLKAETDVETMKKCCLLVCLSFFTQPSFTEHPGPAAQGCLPLQWAVPSPVSARKITKVPHRLAYRHFLSEVSFFPDDPRLDQVDLNLASTVC